VEIGVESNIWPGAVILGDCGKITIGKNTSIEYNCVVRGEVIIMMDLEKRKFGPLRVIPGMNRGRHPYCHSIYIEDHLMHLDLFENLPIWMSEHDAPPLADIEVFLDWYDIIDKDERAYWSVELKKKFHFRPRKPTRFLRDGERIDLGNLSVEVIHTSGHTHGHLAFFFESRKFYF